MIDNSSFWPNGVKVVNGHGRFYPLGTNKVKVPTTGWPKGTKFVSPFVYDKDDNLVSFVDTKAMTSAGDAIYLPYELIEADFPNITQGKLQIHAPKATVKKASWKGSNERIDIPEAQFKYKGYTTIDQIKNDFGDDGFSYVHLADIANGTWSEPLWDLTDGRSMFIGCTNLTSFSSDLPSLTDGYEMFKNCSSLTSFTSELSSLEDGSYMFIGCTALTSFTSDLSSLTNGDWMFQGCSNLTTFTSNLSSLTKAKQMFTGCRNLESFSSDLPSLTDGNDMFLNCYSLKSFSSDLSSLTDSNRMFQSCDNLTTFTSDLPSLTTGNSMFDGCDNLESFSSDLPSLTDGYEMFYHCTKLTSFNDDLPSLTTGTYMFLNCSSLKSFSSDLSSLTGGYQMFKGCKNLTSFSSSLSSLTSATDMFTNCKLDTSSVQKIADTINTPTRKGTIHIGIGNSTPNDQEESAFNKIASRNWTVYVQVNDGSASQWNPTSITPIDGEETTTPIPFWAKPVPATEETASYVDANGNYYNILGGNYIYGDNLETYGMFVSEEDAAANMRLTKFEKPQTEIEKQ